MAHQHGRSHLVRDPQQHHHHHRVDEQEQNGVATVVQTVIQTMPNTYTGEIVWVTKAAQSLVGDPIQHSQPASKSAKATSKEEEDKSSAQATSTKDSSVKASSVTEILADATNSPKRTATTIMVATSSPALTGAAIAATASGTSSPSASATAEAQSSGMSGGAKAGLALGILLGIGAVLGLVLFLYHRKKKQVAAQKAADNEKSAMQNAPPPPPFAAASVTPSIRTARTASTAPRLSLRPVTQFSPTFEQRKSAGNLLDIAAAGGAARGREPSPERPSTSWERPGAAHAAAAPVNPFNDPKPESSPASPPASQNPFGNHAATERQFAPSPSPPPTGRLPTPPNSHLNDFANPAPAIAAADAVPLAMAAVPARKEVPAPAPQIIEAPPAINPDGVPPSPAWTEDIPASPGPAPTGPPPIAAAGGMKGPTPPPNNVHRVQLDFKPSMNDELELRSGQLVRMLHEYDDGWALCIRMDRSQQGVVPRTCLSKHPVKPRTGPPRQPPPGARPRGPPMGPMGPGGIPQPRPLTPNGRNSPQPPFGPANGRMSPAPRAMSPGPRSMSPGPRAQSPNMGPPGGRARSNSNAPYAGPPRSMSPGPYGGGPQQQMQPPSQMPRPRSNSASQVAARRNSPPGPSPMNPNANVQMQMPSRKPLPGLAL